MKIGVAGNSQSFYDDGHTSTIEAGAWCKARGIDIFEYSFGKGINISDDSAAKIGREFRLQGIELSVHAPYYINFANPSREVIEKNYGYVLRSLQKLACFDAGDRMVFHPAAQGKVERQEAFSRTIANLTELSDLLIENKLNQYKICIETMGKLGQIGTVSEVVDFCNIAPFYYPCIDFGHVNARTQGSLKSPSDFEEVIRFMQDNLPEQKVKFMHVHFSKIEYGKSGELRHLTFADQIYGPEFAHFAEIIAKYSLQPTIICESSGTQAEDAMTMRKIMNSFLN